MSACRDAGIRDPVMLSTSTIARFAVFASLASVAWGSPVGDPAMGLDDGSLSSPISNATFTPINGGGVFDFFNDTGAVITLLTFQTTVLPGLSAAQLGLFVCNDATTSGHPNPFFLSCSITYNGSDGLMDISFFGTDALHPGILPADPTCTAPVQNSNCSIGHFFVTLNDGFSLDPVATGGWNDPARVGDNTVGFGVDAINTPEPATVWLAAGAIGLLGVLKLRRRKVSPS